MPQPKERFIMKHKLTSVESGALRTIILPLVLAALGVAALGSVPVARAQDNSSPPTLPSPLCDSLQVPAGTSVVFHGYAIGVQIYRWNGTGWVFVAPMATLYGDPGYNGQVAIHYAGPTWESNSGSKVVGARKAGCTPDSTAIPWLKLAAVSSSGPGVLNRVTYIQRVNTVGGLAPSANGTTVGQVANVPYTAEYFFFSSDTSEE
jgi:hypothetical protein